MWFGLAVYCLLALTAAHKVEKRQADDFADIVRQKTRGNAIRQCPCVIHPESQQCISYDSRYQAVSVEEAVLSFLDLTNHRFPAPIINSRTFSCQTQECQNCYSLLYHKLVDIGFVPSDYRSSINVLPLNNVQSSLCPRFTFPVPPIRPAPPSVVPSYVRNMINSGQAYHAVHSTQIAQTPNMLGRNSPNNGQGPGRNDNSVNQNRQQQQQQNRQNQFQQNRNNQNQQNQARQQQLQQQRQQQQQQLQNQQNQRFQQNQRLQQQLQQQRLQQQQLQVRQNLARQNNWNAQQRQWLQQQQLAQQRGQFQQFQPQQNFVQQPQQQWNGRFWEPVRTAVRTFQQTMPLQQGAWNSAQAINDAQGNAGSFHQGSVPQTPVVQQPGFSWSGSAPSAPVATPGWGASSGFGSAPVATAPVASGGFGTGFGGGFGGFGDRHKRASDAIVGKRYEISCTNKGDSEDDMLSLCGSCWAWRQLPEGYFPRIINELACNPGDFCLSGWGECKQQYRNVDVLRSENGRWIPTVITIATCCDCRVRAGTEIHSLVIGDRK